MTRDDRGSALIPVLLVLALLGVIGTEFAYSMRLEATAVRALKDGIVGAHLAEAAVEQAIREIAVDAVFVGPGREGDLTFYTRQRTPVPRLPRTRVPLGPGEFSYRLLDEEGRLNLNAALPQRVEALLVALGLDKGERDVIVDSLLDWRDTNDEHRLNGAESDDYYLKLPVPYRARNGNLDSTAELLQIRGVTPALYDGAEGGPGLADLVTVKTPGQVNINTAPADVLRALGLAEAEIGEIDQARRDQPYDRLPGQFGGRGLTTTTRTFRIEAEGWVGGRVAARLTAVVQKRSVGPHPAVVVLEWSGSR